MWPSGSLVQLSDKTKIKNKAIAEQEPRSAHGRAVNKFVCIRCCQLLCYRLIRFNKDCFGMCTTLRLYSGKKTDKFSKRGFKIFLFFLFVLSET